MRIWLCLLALSLLAGCAGGGSNATLEEAARVAYVSNDAPRLSLITVINNRTGGGGHTALLISASERVIFDPAGTFRHEQLTERDDVLYGMTPGWIAAYNSAHARDTYHVVTQDIPVDRAQAEQALQIVKANGSVGSAFCANATSSVLKQIPGFEDVSVTFWPVKLMEQIAARPGVVTDRYYENDAGDVVDGIEPADA
ncbi:MAG: hypothetical protein AB8B62_08625 [Roseobacter sp.]